MSPCTCDSGFVYVSTSYADRQVEAIEIPAEGDPRREEVLAEKDRKHRVALDTVYPCKLCAPASFMRWANGHYSQKHDTGCGECARLRTSAKARAELQELAEASLAVPAEKRADYI